MVQRVCVAIAVVFLSACGDQAHEATPISATCGNAVIERGEECDDGDDNGGATCRSNCTIPGCGDGVLDDGEECDGGGETAACNVDCTDASCGDGTKNTSAGEQCDNGEDNDDEAPDACRTTCVNAACGDSVIDTLEDCDDGEDNSDEDSNACRTNCHSAGCGDSVLDDGEMCDAGGETEGCDDDCTDVTCGDGNWNELANEECDDGEDNDSEEPDACRTDCRHAYCGDYVIDSGEDCDQGQPGGYGGSENDGCEEDCRFVCGSGSGAYTAYLYEDHCYLRFAWDFQDWFTAEDRCKDVGGYLVAVNDSGENDLVTGMIDGWETWFGLNDIDVEGTFVWSHGDPVSFTSWAVDQPDNFLGDEDCGNLWPDGTWNDSDCDHPMGFVCERVELECGDHELDAGEQCDDGNILTEMCDYGNEDGCTVCNTFCQSTAGELQFCGDGVEDESHDEECDSGGSNSNTLPNACRENCIDPFCGDGVMDDGEPCDDGANNSDTTPDACRPGCVLPTCGDGVTDTGEECDSFGEDSETCNFDCTAADCSDGYINTVAGEICDDLDEEDGDGCSSLCVVEADSICWGMPSTCGTGTSIAPALAVPDDAYNGSLASMTCADIVIPSVNDGLVNEVILRTHLNHTWVGDLTIKLISPSNFVLILSSRPGLNESADDGAGCCGNSANMSAAFPLTWLSFATSGEQIGLGLSSGNTVCGFNGICDFQPNNGAGVASTLADFAGQTGGGTWKLCIGDSAGQDVGSIGAVDLIVRQ